jgi:hypothetical protein
MSFDLAVFDSSLAPTERDAFNAWFRERTRWADALDYDDPSNLTPPLRAWFEEMICTFPPLNGPLSKEELLDDPHTTDYSLARDLIYAAHAWSLASDAQTLAMQLAARHRVGFFDLASDLVYRPIADGTLSGDRRARTRPWWRPW